MPTKRTTTRTGPKGSVHDAVSALHRSAPAAGCGDLAVESGGYYRPVQALITKALGAGVWKDPRFLQLWEAYRARKYDLDADTVMPYGVEFEAGLIVGMWAGGSALSTIKVEPWQLHDLDDREPRLDSSLRKVTRPGRKPTTPASLRNLLGADAPTLLEHHLAAGVASAGAWMEVTEHGILIGREDSPEFPPYLCTPDPVSGGLLFHIAADDIRLPFVRTRFAARVAVDNSVIFALPPSSLIGRFVRAVYIAEWENIRAAGEAEGELPAESDESPKRGRSK